MNARKPKPAPMPYFDNLPPAALPALQAAWDKVMEKFSMTAIFDSFSRDMNELKHIAPTRPECNDWVNAVRNGHVERPTALTMAATEDEFTPLTPETFPSASQPQGGAMPDLIPENPSYSIPVIPPAAVVEFLDERELKADVAGRLRSVRDELIAGAYAALQANMRRRATQIVASQLRAMADEMEGGGATAEAKFLAACRDAAATMTGSDLGGANICAAMMPGAGEVGPAVLAAGNAIFRDAQKALQLGKGV